MISKRRKHSDWPHLIGPRPIVLCVVDDIFVNWANGDRAHLSEPIGIVEWMAR